MCVVEQLAILLALLMHLLIFNDIDFPYLDGVSVTYGSPCQHIWNLAAGHVNRCPCENADRNFAPLPPAFVGDNYLTTMEHFGMDWTARPSAAPRTLLIISVPPSQPPPLIPFR